MRKLVVVVVLVTTHLNGAMSWRFNFMLYIYDLSTMLQQNILYPK